MQKGKKMALIGDVGGTNIRLQLIEVNTDLDIPQKSIKEMKYNVKEYGTFQGAIQTFLQEVAPQYKPTVAVIGIAGPITDNTVFLANVDKWGTLDGHQLGKNLQIPHFQFLNDFQAASYGILLLPQHQFVSINGKPINPNKTRGIMGPGTGLGNSVLFPIKQVNKVQTIVIPSQGGHTDFPTIDQQTTDYINFFKKTASLNYISLQRSFCGPSFPVMFQFFAEKYPEDPQAKQEVPTPEIIMQRALVPNPPRIYDEVFKLFAKIYGSAIGNFSAQHITVGGMYLVNSITKCSIPRLEGTDMLKQFKARHPDVAPLIENVPISVCKVVELGMKGAFFVARRTFQNQ